MLLSSGVVWRHREWTIPARVPGRRPAAAARLGAARRARSTWLGALGAPVVAEETGNPLTTGVRFDPRALVAALSRRAGDVRLGEPLPAATSGRPRHRRLRRAAVRPAAPLRLRANPWSTGGGLEHARARGAALTAGMDEFYGRNMPDAAWDEHDLVARPSSTRATRGSSTSAARSSSARTTCRGRSERRPGDGAARGRARVLPARRGALGAGCRGRTVGALVEAARARRVAPPASCPFPAPAGNGRRGARRGRDHAHDRRPARGREARVLDEAGHADPGPVGRGRRRRRRRDRRLRERPGPGGRARPGRGRIDRRPPEQLELERGLARLQRPARGGSGRSRRAAATRSRTRFSVAPGGYARAP